MKEKYKKISKFILILILLILFVKIFFLKNLSNAQTIDDIIFLKLLSNGNFETTSNANTTEKREYKFKINYSNMDFKSVDLSQTVNKDTLVYEKIAPGTNGSFSILLDTNHSLNYKILFFSLNEKPKNLNFIALKNDRFLATADTLEELSNSLSGFIERNQKINITINWYWDYEKNSEESDIQDTNDAENIRRYQFNICTIGEEIT